MRAILVENLGADVRPRCAFGALLAEMVENPLRVETQLLGAKYLERAGFAVMPESKRGLDVNLLDDARTIQESVEYLQGEDSGPPRDEPLAFLHAMPALRKSLSRGFPRLQIYEGP